MRPREYGKERNMHERVMHERIMPRSVRWYVAVWVCALLVFGALAQPGRANVIFVTTLNDTIGDASGCSLKDAIFASTLHSNLARTGYDDNGTPQYVTTQCVPGDGNDTIVLPTSSLLQINRILDDADNSTGPTATPVIASNITIEANGTTFQWIGCPASSCAPAQANHFRAFTVGSAGHLTIRNAHLKGFMVLGGDGVFGSGGGMGAGGAIYVQGGSLTVENTTFDGNTAMGGDGGGVGGQGFSASDSGGGGGGLGGSGGTTTGAEIGFTLRHLAEVAVVGLEAMGQMKELIPITKSHQAAEVAAHSEAFVRQ